MKILFVWPNKDQFGFKPIGLAILNSIAKNNNYETKLFDTTEIDFGFSSNTEYGEEVKIFKPIDFSKYNINKKKINLEESFTKIFNEFEPDIVAFSVLSDEQLIAFRIAKTVKKLNPKTPMIWGGKYCTLKPEKTLKEYLADYICIGEGLEAFPEFLKAFAAGEDPSHIKNMWTKRDGKIIKTELRPLKKELDDLPYADWDIFDKRHFYKPFDGKIYRGGDHMLNWGCPYHCTYCINHIYHRLYEHKYYLRRYGIRRIIDELIYLKEKYKLEFFKFHDEDFLMRPLDNLEELSKEYKRRLNLPFVIETNPKTITEEKVELLKNMNCVSASIAIETGNQKIRETILERVDSQEDIKRAFKAFKKIGVRSNSFNMLAIPSETRETYMETVKVNREAEVQYPLIGFFFPFEGTKLREIAIKEGLFDPDGKDHDAVYQHDKPALHLKNFADGELNEMKKVFVLYIKLPEDYRNFIKRSETQDETGKRLRKKLLEIYEATVWKNDGWYTDDGRGKEYLDELNAILNT